MQPKARPKVFVLISYFFLHVDIGDAGFGGGKAKPKEGAKPSADDAAEGIKTLSVSGSTPIIVSHTAELERIKKTRKNLDVLAEYKKTQAKENANFVVIGMMNITSGISEGLTKFIKVTWTRERVP